MEIVLKAKDLCKTFSNESMQQHVLKNLNLEIRRGEFAVIMGNSGSGKSTALNCLLLNGGTYQTIFKIGVETI